MKTEKLFLGVLCLGACVWSTSMIISVVALARYQGPSALFALIEVAAFVGAGLVPLLFIRKSEKKDGKLMIVLWVICVAYASLLAINALRLELFTKGAVRLALWIAITALFIRVIKHQRKPA